MTKMLYFFPVIIGCGNADVGFSGSVSAEVDAAVDVRLVLGAGGVGGRQFVGAGGRGTGGVVVIADAATDAPWSPRDCATDGKCPAGQTCIDGTCAPHCRTDADCFPGYKCRTQADAAQFCLAEDAPWCGDGAVTGHEQCDGQNLYGASCSSLNHCNATGYLTCANNCQLDNSQCACP